MTIKTENWLGEYTSTIGTGDIILGGAIDGFADFSNVGDNVDVYYTIMDALDKETGIGTLTAGKLVRTTIHATLVGGVYVKNGSPLSLSGDAQVYGTANAHFLEYVKTISEASEANTQAIENLLQIQINGHTLNASFNLTASEVNARPDNWTPTANEVGAYSKTESDTKFLNAQDAEQSAGKVMRVGGARDQELQQQINDVSTAFIGSAPPAGAPVGKRWFDTISGRTFIKYNDGNSTQWVEESPAGAAIMVPSDRPVLCIDFVQLRSKMWKGYLPSDGQILNRADWPDAWASISAGLVPVCSDADWLSTPSNRGCFTAGNGTTTFRMADYNGKSSGSLGAAFLRGDGLNSAGTNGVIQGDAIRDIRGTLAGISSNVLSGPSLGTGAFSKDTGLTTLTGGASGSMYGGIFAASNVVPTAADNHPVNITGCFAHKMLGALQTNLPLISASQLAALEARIAALEAQP